MNEKSFRVLELPKVLEQLARHSTFSAGADLVRALAPTTDLVEAQAWQQQTTEACTLFEVKTEISLGGARDIRAAALQAAHGIIAEPGTFLDIRGTLRTASTVRRTLTRLKGQFPALGEIAEMIQECTGLQAEIGRVLDDNGNILDSASPKLALIRRDMMIAFDRLQTRLNSIVNNANSAKFLQEQLITQRNGRYVIPLRSEFKGRIPGIVHDQSSSGATIFIEPLATVELNNTWRELQLAEEDEIRRILQALTDSVGNEANFLVQTVETLARLDMIFAKARYASAIRATAPKLVGFKPKEGNRHPGSTIKLELARHPLLNPRTVVPIDLTLDEETYCLVITGPNTGGKTVALKTIGLLTLMAQCGMHIPADEGAELSVFEGVYADIGDEQSIEQSLSTFSAHMTNTIEILQQASSRSLVLLDELGAGTDPAEGSALARAILTFLLERQVTTLVTTHHPELKVYSHQTAGVRNASVEFDLETLRPTYRLIVGIPGRSNALAIATRLGIPSEIIDEARTMVGEDELIADDFLDEIQKTREEARRSRDAAVAQQNRAEEMKRELRQRLDDLEKERRDVIAETRRMADREIEALRSEVRHVKQNLQAAGQPLDAIKRVEEQAYDLKAAIDAPIENVTESPPLAPGEEPMYRLGESVWVRPLRSLGEITELSSFDAEVAVGRLRVRVSLDEIDKRPPDENRGNSSARRRKLAPLVPVPVAEKTRQRETVRETLRGVSPGLELDLRGTRIEDAVEMVDNYLDSAYMAGLPFVRIIHGKGTGALRRAVRDLLHQHPLVSRYTPGEEKEGGDGVTVVNIVAGE
ncbi:MAG TPA: endonuclease MutS2 [Aggregatilineales bacterium]|nr:endonuclease MutS2 [Aggregatilineales bacterium]